MVSKVGIDLVSIDEVRATLRGYGERYVHRIYTEFEQRDCGGDPRLLAGRFAAKEAAMKALGRADEPLAWRSIGVREDASGRVRLELTGAAAALARRACARHLDLSISARRSSAVAVVLAHLQEST